MVRVRLTGWLFTGLCVSGLWAIGSLLKVQVWLLGSAFYGKYERTCGIPERPSENLSALCLSGRVLPSVFLVGTNKAGTTNLFWTLMETFPELMCGGGSEVQGSLAEMSTSSVSRIEKLAPWTWKEKLFWTRHLNKGLKWYIDQYPRCEATSVCHRGSYRRCVSHCATSSSGESCAESCSLNCKIQRFRRTSAFRRIGFDASVEMLYWSEVPGRLSQVYGDLVKSLRFIALLRDPVETFHAHVHMRRRSGEVEDFSAIAEYELAAAAPGTPCGNIFTQGRKWDNEPCILVNVRSLMHAAHDKILDHWLSFVDPSQFLLIFSDAFFKAPREGLIKIAHALDLPGCIGNAQSLIKTSNARARRNNVGSHRALSDENQTVVGAVRLFFVPIVSGLEHLLAKHSDPEGFQVVGWPSWFAQYNNSFGDSPNDLVD